MSPPWLSTWGSTSPFAFSCLGPTTSCSYMMSIVFRISTFILKTSISADVSPPSTLACTCSSIFSFRANANASSILVCTCSSIFSFRANASASSTLACTYSSIFSLGANASESSTLVCACYPTTPTFTSPFITPPMPSIDSVRACWCIVTFLVFFRMYI